MCCCCFSKITETNREKEKLSDPKDVERERVWYVVIKSKPQLVLKKKKKKIKTTTSVTAPSTYNNIHFFIY